MRCLLLYLCVCAAAAALEFVCEPPTCSVSVNGGGWFTFEIEGGKVEIRESSFGSFFVECRGWNALEAQSMPRFLSTTYANQVYLSDCPLPTGNASIADTFQTLNVTLLSVNGETHLQLFDLKSVPLLSAHHFSGLEFLTNLTIMTFEKPDPVISAEIFSKLQNLRSLTLLGVQIKSGELSQLPKTVMSLTLIGNSLKMLSNTFLEAVAEISLVMPKLKTLQLDALRYVDSKPTTTNEIKLRENQKNKSSIEALTLNRWMERRLTPLQRCNRLRTLDLYDCSVEKLPDRFLAECPNLEVLSIRSASNLDDLPAKFLEGAVALKRLKIRYSKVQWLPEEFFQGAPNLCELNLSNNKLRQLPGTLFLGLPLRSLTLENNRLEGDVLSALASLTTLTELKLQNNNFKQSCDDAGYSPLRNLTQLKTLDLSNTKIDQICRDWRQNLVNLKNLNLIGTKIMQLKYDDLQYTRDPSIDDAEVALDRDVKFIFSEEDYKKALTAPTSGATVRFPKKTSSPHDCDGSFYWLGKAMIDASHAVKVNSYSCIYAREPKDPTTAE